MDEVLKQTLTGRGDSDRHALTLLSLVVSLKARNVLELGVRNGDTTRPIIEACKLVGATLTSVDVSPTPFTSDYPEWKFIESDAIKYLESVPAGVHWDLVYIDDWHSYPHVKRELELLDAHVSPRSLIVLHDLMYANYEPHYHCDLHVKEGQWALGGPYRAVAELSENFWEFATIPVNNGLTILRKKYSSKFFT